MQTNWRRIVRRTAPEIVMLLAFPAVGALAAQNPAVQAPARADNEIFRTIYLHHIAGRNDLNDIQTALRSALRRSMFYGDESQKAIVFRGTPEDFEAAQKIVEELDRSRPAYRLTYTITDISGGKPAGSRKFTITALDGQLANFRQGDRVPIVTGKPGAGSAEGNSQVTYVDVGINIRATLNASVDSVNLQSLIEESAVAQESIHAQDPVIHQTVLDSAATLTPGKPQQLGSLDIPGTARHEQIEVTAEPIGQ